MSGDGSLLQFLQGGGELGALIRSKDWSATLLGPSEFWPQSLKTTLGILLNSRYPMFVFWGPQLIKIYNDGYKPILGRKHPWALGQPAREVWPEIWPAIEPLVDRALSGDPTWSDDLMLFMERNGFPEEVYFTFSYSPIPDESGGIGGMFCACTETTGEVLGERRLRTLRDLAAALAETRTERDTCMQAANLLHENAADVPFAVIYLLDEHGRAQLAAQAGAGPGHPVAPVEIFRGHEAESWPVYDAIDGRSARLVSSLGDRLTVVPAGPWPEPPDSAMVLPLIDRSLDRAIGAIVLGISSRRPFDADYRGWFDLVAGQLGASITSARAVEQERRRAEALADLDRAKTAFFSNVSHEFRTPLTLMLGPTEEALASGDAALGGEALRMVHRNQLRLLKLVNSLLDFSRLHDGRAQAQREATDLAALTASLAGVFRSAIERAGLRLIVNCEPMAEPVLIDREMWEKIVFNLLSNAFKFTLEGEIEVVFSDGDGGVVLTVRDTGTGIPAGELPRIFERFHRIAGAKGRTFEGSGIGLALVHELVTLLGGTVSVESDLGRGSTFTVRLPHAALPQLAKGSPMRALAAPSVGSDGYLEEMLRTLPKREGSAPPPSASGRPRVVVADDNADMREYISRLLSPDYDVIAVGDGEAALDAVQAQRVDLVLSDVMMPRLNGVELLERLRADDRTRTLPVILVSARAGEDDTVAGLHTGADDYLVKPFSARELIARVHARLEIAAERKRREDALRSSEERFRLMADHAPVMVWVTEPDGRCTFLSRSWYEFTGQTPETGLGHGWVSAVHPDDRAHASQVFLNANQERAPFQLEYRLRRHDGVFRWALDAAAPRFGATGEHQGYIGSVIDITERKHAEDEMRQSRQQLRLVTDAIPALVSYIDADRRYRFNNRAYADWFGHEPHDLQGQTMREVLGEQAYQQLQPHVDRVLAGEMVSFDGVVNYRNAGPRDVHVSYVPDLDESGVARGFYALITDQSARHEAEQALRDADRRKDEFLAMLAHELRSPLAPIRSAAEVLRLGDAQGGPQQWAREVIERQTQHLTRLVDDLLDVSRITRGMITIRREPLDLAVIVRRSVETSRPMIDSRHQQLTVTLPPEPLQVAGDLTRLVQVIANLLNNAAKYTEEGGRIDLQVRNEDGSAAISVRDNGIGLSAELLPHVFDLFTQASRSLDRSQGGLGIGLTLVRRLVELHGGTVDARSDGPGHGSEFIVHLPLLAGDTRLSDPGDGDHAAEMSTMARALRVLVVEDHPDSADMMAFLIEAHGHQVFKARDGASALATALAVRPNVVFCDIGLPGMNGYELAAEMRKQSQLGDMRLIAVSGYGREEDRQRAEAAGFDAHLTKPIEPQVLHSLLQLGVNRA
jgi:PAS domain S-box-containing protein